MRKRLAVPAALLGMALCCLAAAEPPPAPCRDASVKAALAQLGLSAAQKQSVHQILGGHQQAMNNLRRSEQQQHQAFLKLDPGDPHYATEVGDLAEQAAALAAQRVQEFAAIKSQIYAVLTEAQRSQFAALLGSMNPSELPPPVPASN
jgi:Spy/CpxP family protein refolding chaperone